MRRHGFRFFWSVMLTIVVTVGSVFAEDDISTSATDQVPPVANMAPISAMSGLGSVNVENVLNLDGLNWARNQHTWGVDTLSPDTSDNRVWRKLYANPQGLINATSGPEGSFAITPIFQRGIWVDASQGLLMLAKVQVNGSGSAGVTAANGLPNELEQRRIILWSRDNQLILRYLDRNRANPGQYAFEQTVAVLDVDPISKNLVMGYWLEPDGRHVRVILPSGEMTEMFELPSSLFEVNGKFVVYPGLLAGYQMELVVERMIFMYPKLPPIARP